MRATIAVVTGLLMCALSLARAQEGIRDGMPSFYPALKARLTFPMAWSPAQTDLAAWRRAGRDKIWQATVQVPDHTPFESVLLSEAGECWIIWRWSSSESVLGAA